MRFIARDVIRYNQITLEQGVKTLQETIADISWKITDLKDDEEESSEIQDLPIENINACHAISLKCTTDPVFSKSLVKTLSVVGGKSIEDAVRKVINRLFTSYVQKNINYSGKNNKLKFADSPLLKIVLDTVKLIRTKDFAEDIALRAVKFYLQRADERFRLTLKRKNISK